jgi:hypothetical protein
LEAARLQVDDIDGVPLAYFDSGLAFKSSLLLAPSLKETVMEKVGWPLMAVVPHRGFLMFWPSANQELAGRVGGVVVEEFRTASYPLSTEVFEVNDTGINAMAPFRERPTNGYLDFGCNSRPQAAIDPSPVFRLIADTRSDWSSSSIRRADCRSPR